MTTGTALLKIFAWILLILFLSAPVGAFRVDIAYKHRYADANKTEIKGDADDLLCWAAVASNMVSWHQRSDAQITFEWFIATTENPGPSRVEKAIRKFGQITKLEWRLGDAENIQYFIWGSLIKGEVVGINIDKVIDDESFVGNYAHTLTVYGFTINKFGMFIEYVDSDDNKRKMYKAKVVKLHGFLKIINGHYSGHTILFAYSLKK